jgi:hypothetical protein
VLFFELFPAFMTIVAAIVGVALFVRNTKLNDPNDPNGSND